MDIVYAQFFKLRSVDDLVDRLATAIFQGIHAHESLLDRGKQWLKVFNSLKLSLAPSPDGSFSFSVEPARHNLSPIERLDTLLGELGTFLESFEGRACIALDEFQDIADLKDSRIEAIMREHIQHHHAGFIFLGSRRRLLRDIFVNKGRPFYQSGIMHELASLPRKELGSFVTEQFAIGGKKCSMDIGLSMADCVGCYPYYAQALAYWSFALSDPECTSDIVDNAFSNLMGSERYGFEAILQALTSAQASLLRALALQPVMQPASREFLQTFGLSAGGVQKSLAHLDKLDLIERPDTKGPWKVIDPVFKLWITETFG